MAEARQRDLKSREALENGNAALARALGQGAADTTGTAVEALEDQVHYLSVHNYVGDHTDTLDFLACPRLIEKQIQEGDAVCRYVQVRRKSPKRAFLAFDEWNVWYRTQAPEYINRQGRVAPPLIEERYKLEDALVVAGILHAFLQHANVVKMANLAQIVNVLAPLLTRTDDLLVQSIYWPFQLFSARREGRSLVPIVEGPTYSSPTYGEVSHVDASAILDDDRLHVFLTNRDESQAEVRVRLAGLSLTSFIDAAIVTGADPKDENAWDTRDRISAQPYDAIKVGEDEVVLRLPPFAFVAAKFSIS